MDVNDISYKQIKDNFDLRLLIIFDKNTYNNINKNYSYWSKLKNTKKIIKYYTKNI